MKHSDAKLFFSILIASFLLTIFCMVAMANSSLRIIYFGMRHDVSMLSIGSQISSLLQKLICGAVLLTSGIFCIYLYLQTYESEHFLQISAIFFLSAGLIMSLQDYKVLFYATSPDRKLFNLCADIFLLLFSCFIFCERMDISLSTHLRIGQATFIAVHLALCVLRLFMKTVPFINVLKIYALGACVCTLVLFALSKPSNRHWTLASLLPLNAILLTVAHLKFNSLSNFYENYLRIVPFAIIVYVMLLFNARYQLHRMAILLGRVGKRKLQEDEQYRRLTVHTLFLYCSKSLDRLSHIARRMMESNFSNDALTKAGAEIQREVRDLYTSITNAQQHIRIQNAMLTPDMHRVSIHAIFSYVREEVENALQNETRFEICASRDWEVRGDPMLLIRANCSIFNTFQEFGQLSQVRVSLCESNGFIKVQIDVMIDKISVLNAHRLIRKFKRIDSMNRSISNDELNLTIAKAILAAHNTSITLHKISDNRFSLNYRLSKWVAEESQTNGVQTNVADSDNSSESDRQAIHVAFLSTSERQLEFTRNCLIKPVFHLHEFTDATVFLSYLEKNRVNVVIIGALYIRTDLLHLCHTIRDRFAIGLLPIILYQHDAMEPICDELHKYINDFLFDPCNYDEMGQRVLSLAMMQRSTEELRLARLEFLQSQMDPHFIFNAINVIMPLCLRDPKQAYALLGNFSDYLHGNLFPKESNSPIYVYEEVDLIRAYLALENARMPDLIDYEIIEKYDEGCHIFPLMIEPLVENCVKHGLRRNCESPLPKLHIMVSIIQQDESLTIVVQDDGVGFDLNDSRSSSPRKGKIYRSIGIDNLRKRLMLYYHANLIIDSQPGIGTHVSFVIPAFCDSIFPTALFPR